MLSCLKNLHSPLFFLQITDDKCDQLPTGRLDTTCIETYHVCSLLLSSHSVYFDKLLNGEFMESKENKVRISLKWETSEILFIC